jgi:protein-histidine pros-kinase
MLSEATLFMRSGTAVRSYTQNEIRPLISDQIGCASCLIPVPSWSAHRAAPGPEGLSRLLLQGGRPQSTNPADRATAWEADIIQEFKRDGKLTEFVTTRDTCGTIPDLRPSFRLTKGCLSCHSTPAAAPATMVDLYGNSNGFGWVLTDVIGAQIVSYRR